MSIRTLAEVRFAAESFVDSGGNLIRFDPEFAGLIPPLSPHECVQLERNLRHDGVCLCPIIVWKGRNIVLDGHYRIWICERNGIPYSTVELQFSNRQEAREWIIRHHLGRRNLAELQRISLTDSHGEERL